MTHDDAFLQVIAESPDDDAPRLIYADWLQDHDQPERAEFIRLQCRLAGAVPDEAERLRLETRERELLARHEREWLGPLQPLLARWAFRRGFLEAVALPALVYVDHADLIRQNETIRRVEVILSGADIAATIVALVPETVARERFVFPIGRAGDGLVLAALDPVGAAKLAPFLGRPLDVVEGQREEIVEAINRHYRLRAEVLPDSPRRGMPDTVVDTDWVD
jgi:uncharacterized protein (TIGR02996 family)